MSDVASVPVTASTPPAPASSLTIPAGADHTDYTVPPVSAPAAAPVSIASLAPAPIVSTPGGNAGLSEYVGDFAESVSVLLPPSVRAVLYPLGFLVSAVAVGLGAEHVISLTAAGLIAVTAQAFTNGLALGNVNKASGK